MEVKLRVLLLNVFVVAFVKGSAIPVEKCKLEDNDCMTAAFQKALLWFVNGLPEYGVEVLDVMNLDDFKFDLSGLQFSLKDGQMKGLKTTVIDRVKWDLPKNILQIEYNLNATMKGHYTAGGRILVLPITGDGQMKLRLRNVHLKMYIHYVMEKGSSGKQHVVPKKLTFDFVVKDNMHVSLTNLFNGNKELSDTTLNFINDNWKEVSNEFGKPIIEVVAKKILKNVGKFLAKLPIEDITIA